MRKKHDGTLNGEGRTDVKCKDLEKRTGRLFALEEM